MLVPCAISKRVWWTCGLGVMGHAPGRRCTRARRKWDFEVAVGGMSPVKPARRNCFSLDPFLHFATGTQAFVYVPVDLRAFAGRAHSPQAPDVPPPPPESLGGTSPVDIRNLALLVLLLPPESAWCHPTKGAVKGPMLL